MVSLLMLLSACSLSPKMSPAMHSVQVEVSAKQRVDLPQPKALQQTINVSQLITAQWSDESKQTLLVQLQVNPQKVVLAGFSAWGVKLLSLTYWGHDVGNKIETNVITGFGNTLPPAEQILFNVMLAIWPKSSWDKPLANIAWTLKENNLQRLLFDEHGELIVSIDYQKKPYLEGKIIFKHHPLDYTIIIETKRMKNNE